MDDSLGIVVSPFFNLDKNPRCHVLDVDALLRIGTAYTVPVDEMAFRLPPDSHNMEVALRKNQERRLSRPLNFGNCITWRQSDLIVNRKNENTITRFDRQLDLFPTRVRYGKFQLLLDGVVNPNHPTHLYTEYIRAIRIPDEKRRGIFPNIYYKVWITFDCLESGALNIEFGDFHNVAPAERQLDVAGAPWNKHLPKFCVSMPYSDSEDDDGYGGFGYMVANKKPDDSKPLIELFRRDATLTGFDRMIMWEFPHLKTVLPIYNEGLQIGRLYNIDCCWNQFENMYMVTRIGPSKKNENLRTSDDGEKKLRCSVKASSIPGVFENAEFGQLDDPKGVLNLLPFTRYAENAIPVTIDDTFPSRGGQFRFSIAGVYGDKKEKWEEIANNGDFHVENELGVVIDGSRVICATYAPNVFKLATKSDPPPVGSRIRFSADYVPVLKAFEINEWSVDPSLHIVPVVDRIMNPKTELRQALFFVTGKIPIHKKLDKTIMTEEFGLVDDNLELVKFVEKNPHNKLYQVWVTLAGEDDPVKCRTTFQVIGVGDIPPEDRINEDGLFLSSSDVNLHTTFRNIVSVASSRASTASHNGNSTNNPDDTMAHDFELTLDDCVSVASHASERTLRPPSTAFESPVPNYVNSRAGSLVYEDEPHPASMMTVDGNIDPARHIRDSRARVVHKYDGPVKMPPGSTHTFNVVETLSRLKYSIQHSARCGLQCAGSCPWLSELASLVVIQTGFWEDAEKFYPTVANVLLSSLSNMG